MNARFARFGAPTARQLQLLFWLAHGRRGQGLVLRMGVGAATVRSHWKELRTKLGARTYGHAVWLGVTLGLLEVVSPNSGANIRFRRLVTGGQSARPRPCSASATKPPRP